MKGRRLASVPKHVKETRVDSRRAACSPLPTGSRTNFVGTIRSVPVRSGPRPPSTLAAAVSGRTGLELSWEEIVRRAQRKDATAFAQLIGRHERAALAVAFGVLNDASAAGDA